MKTKIRDSETKFTEEVSQGSIPVKQKLEKRQNSKIRIRKIRKQLRDKIKLDHDIKLKTKWNNLFVLLLKITLQSNK